MGGGKGGGDTQTVQKADPWSGQQPFLIGGNGRPIYEYVDAPQANQGVNGKYAFTNRNGANSGPQRRVVGYEGGTPGVFPEAARIYQEAIGLPYYPGQTFTDFSDDTLQAFDMMRGDQTIAGARDMYSDIIGGDYMMGGDKFMGAYGNDIIDQVNSQFAKQGAVGGSYHGGQMVDDLADASGRFWQQDIANMMRAGAIAPSLAYADANQRLNIGGAIEGKQQQAINDDIARYNYPVTNQQNALANYVAAIQGNYGGTNTTTGEGGGGGSSITGALGGAAAAGGIYSMFAPAGAGLGAYAPWLAGGALVGGLFS